MPLVVKSQFLKYLLLLFCFLLPALVKAQYKKSVLELQSDSLLADLRHQGIDTVCVYESYCVGCRDYHIRDDSPCRTKGTLIPTYFLWRTNGLTYARKLDNCSISPNRLPIKFDFWTYFFRYSTLIKREKIKPFVNLDHGSVCAFTFYIRSDTTSQYFRSVNLERALRHPKKKNPHYHHNTRTHTAHIYEMLEAVTALFPQP